MSTQPISSTDAVGARSRSSAFWTATPFWATLSIISMWLAVLFVGVYGGSVQKSSPGGGTSSWPVVVVVAIVAMIATIVVGGRAFSARPVDDDLRRTLEKEEQARQKLAAEVSELRATLSS